MRSITGGTTTGCWSRNGRNDDAWAALQQAYDLLLDSVRSVRDEGLRRNCLNKVKLNRELVQGWLRESAQRGLPEAERLAHLNLESHVGEPFKRLVWIPGCG